MFRESSKSESNGVEEKDSDTDEDEEKKYAVYHDYNRICLFCCLPVYLMLFACFDHYRHLLVFLKRFNSTTLPPSLSVDSVSKMITIACHGTGFGRRKCRTLPSLGSKSTNT